MTIDRERIKYAGLIVLTIALGLLSRKIPIIPAGVGDALWAVMIYFIVSFLRVNCKKLSTGLTGLVICYCVEFSQLYQAPWINSIRGTLIGHLLLGQGFLWSDLVAYAVGIGIVTTVEYWRS